MNHYRFKFTSAAGLLAIVAIFSSVPHASAAESAAKKGKEISEVVEIGCGKHQFKMKGVETCELAARIGKKTYLVTGEYIDPKESGLCDAIKKAEVVGRIVRYPNGVGVGGQDSEFIATSIKIKEDVKDKGADKK